MMNWELAVEAVLLGAALAMDAVAASVALAAAGRWTFNPRRMLITAGFFGLFQCLMPLIGFYGSSWAGSLVESYGKYIAGLLLIAIGSKMFSDGESNKKLRFSLQQLLLLALATSLDALLVGVSFSFQRRTSIWLDAVIIGFVTALLAWLGCVTGRWSGKLLGKNCTWPGALVLVLLGLKIIIFS